ncbi:MAG: malto-oligosyltrehalose trehalohydrolase [Gemmatimonadetes bacterium]|nr:malto-oligosyltrehalose trehalohydrolase [Gemmatimonadota bacterium]
MSHLWSSQAGAQPQPDNSVRFTLWAPHAKRPRVRVCSGDARGDHSLTAYPGGLGRFVAEVPNVRAGDDYLFVLDDERELPDPASRWQPHGVHGPSRVVDPAFGWTDQSWRGVSMDELVIYELHVGTFTPEGTFAAIVPHLAELKTLGVSAIELMPVAQFPGARNWGYDGVGLYAAQDSYGGPAELKKLVNAAHAAGLAVLLDVVYNHVGPEGNYLDAFGPYFTDVYRTPWGRAINYDGPDSDDVRRFVVGNALHWIGDYHIDGLRLDAVHSIFDFGARHVLEEIAAEAHALGERLGRSVVVIAESDLNDPRIVRSADEYGYGLDGQWSDDFHHAVHAALTGETRGYFADFGPVSAIASALREPFVYDGRYSMHRRRRHGAPSVGLPRKRFVVAIQNHDQVGNRAKGDRLSTLLAPEQLRLAAALLLLSPYVPLIFMGEEYGETNPFPYFVSHGDPELIEAVRAGRRGEFQSFDWDAEVPDPHDESVFRQATLDRPKAARPPHAQLLALYRDLLALRRDEPLMRPDGARLAVEAGERGWITLLRQPVDESPGASDALLALFNCSGEVADVPIPGSTARAWTMRLSTDAVGYGGNAELATDIVARGAEPDAPKRLATSERTLSVPPWTAALYMVSS